jgi:hypothetical protein
MNFVNREKKTRETEEQKLQKITAPSDPFSSSSFPCYFSWFMSQILMLNKSHDFFFFLSSISIDSSLFLTLTAWTLLLIFIIFVVLTVTPCRSYSPFSLLP